MSPDNIGGESAGDEPRVVIRDKRRLDPETGEVRVTDPGVPAGDGGPAGDDSVPDTRIAELTETLQRLKAEYDNYRKRSERDRLVVADIASGNVLAALLPVLDDLERARAHGDLTGAFGSVGEALIVATGKFGLETYGQAGEPFDPQIHEAVMQAPPVEGVDGPVLADVFRSGYRHAGRVLRPAQVSVSEPAEAQTAVEVEEAEST